MGAVGGTYALGGRAWLAASGSVGAVEDVGCAKRSASGSARAEALGTAGGGAATLRSPSCDNRSIGDDAVVDGVVTVAVVVVDVADTLEGAPPRRNASTASIAFCFNCACAETSLAIASSKSIADEFKNTSVSQTPDRTSFDAVSNTHAARYAWRHSSSLAYSTNRSDNAMTTPCAFKRAP